MIPGEIRVHTHSLLGMFPHCTFMYTVYLIDIFNETDVFLLKSN